MVILHKFAKQKINTQHVRRYVNPMWQELQQKSFLILCTVSCHVRQLFSLMAFIKFIVVVVFVTANYLLEGYRPRDIVLRGDISKGTSSVFTHGSKKIKENSERLGRRSQHGFESNNSCLPTLWEESISRCWASVKLNNLIHIPVKLWCVAV